jgi:glycine cleavage system H protein
VRAGLRPARRVVGWFSLPGPYCYHQGHTWAVPETGNIVRVGIDEFVRWLVGPASDVDLPRVGSYLAQGRTGWSIKVNSKSVDILSPVEGEVVAVNSAVLKSPQILCSDPYGRGWLLKVRVPDRKRNQKNLLCSGVARAWMEQQVRDVRARALPALGLDLALPEDGGPAGCVGFARMLAPENWDEVASELLLSRD